ncbi:Alpha/Beta hydrolase protein [Lactarius psammicola]|nr:Alpha/Beta hydrolase protein [Lactarius psammicola]
MYSMSCDATDAAMISRRGPYRTVLQIDGAGYLHVGVWGREEKHSGHQAPSPVTVTGIRYQAETKRNGSCADHLQFGRLPVEEKPLKITVSDDALALLKRMLDDTSLPEKVNTTEWAYGVPLADIRQLARRWKDGFTRTITVDGFGELSVHYVHQRSTTKDAIPLLFVHGWPGKLPRGDEVSDDHSSFHVVASGLPRFAWSERVLEKGFHAEHYAELTLTTAANYGPKHVNVSHTKISMLAALMARPPLPSGSHCEKNKHRCDPPSFRENPIPITLPKYLVLSPTAHERQFATHTENFFKNGKGYSTEQSTKPQTIGFSPADPPSLQRPFGSTTSSHLALVGQVFSFPETTVPVGLSYFPKHLAQSVRAYHASVYLGLVISVRGESSWLRVPEKFAFELEHDVGGHLAAYEQPEAFIGDLRGTFDYSGLRRASFPVVPVIDRPERINTVQEHESTIRLGSKYRILALVLSSLYTHMISSASARVVHVSE